MANPRVPDPSRATVLGEEPPPAAVPTSQPVPTNDRPVRPVARPVASVIAASEPAVPPEMVVDLSRRTMVPEEGTGGAPAVPMELKGVRTLGLGTAKITNAPPPAPSPLQKVALRIKPRNVADARSEPWIQSPKPLGKPVAVNGKMVAVFIAAQVTDFFAGAEEGAIIVEVDLVFAPVEPGSKIAEDWALRYEQNHGELRKALTAALYSFFSRHPLWPGLVVRFVGGPPMTQEDADANRYQFWIDDDRSPTRVEIDDRFVDAAREAAELDYLAAEQRWFTAFTVLRWKRKDPPRYRRYLLGKLLAKRIDPPKLGGRELEALKTALSEHAGPVISSFSAVVFGNDLDAEAALRDKGRTPVRPTAIGRPVRATFLEHEPLPDDAVAALGDSEG